MGQIKIKQRLGRQYRLLLIGLLLAAPVLALWLHFFIRDYARSPHSTSLQKALLMDGMFLVIYFTGLGYSIWQLARMDRHPDLVRLARYGPLADLLPAIEAELADPKQVVRIGQVWFTRSWLMHEVAEKDQMRFFRLKSIVLAAQVGNAVLLADEQGARLTIPGTETNVTRLLAEILMRVPWALNHFDPETEKKLHDNRQQIITEVEQCRRQIKGSAAGAGPPGC